MRYLILFLLIFNSLSFAKPDYNFLFVLDNSGSMIKQRELIDKNFGKFLEELRKNGITKFKMGITTTDFFAHLGHLYPPEISAPALITNETEDPARVFSQFLASVKETPTSFWEQGLQASMAVLNTFPETFLTDNDHLVVIYVSDEEDYSCKENCFGVEPENNPNWQPYPAERYIDFFNALKNQKKMDVSLFPIVGLPEGTCSVPSYGTRYLKVRAAIGGIAGSVCESDVVASFLKIPEYLGSPDMTKPHWITDPIVFKAMEDRIFIADLASYAKGNRLRFSKNSGPAWMMLSMTGTISGTPIKENLGENTAVIRATDMNGESADVTVKVVVGHVNHPPNWLISPIDVGKTKQGEPVTFNLGSYVQDPDGDPLVFRTLAGPAFLTMSTNGNLSGIPTPNDVGAFHMQVIVSDGWAGLNSTNTIIGEVIP